MPENQPVAVLGAGADRRRRTGGAAGDEAQGLQLLINNALPAGEQRYGDREALRRTLVLLIQYSVTTTPIGKITLDVCRRVGQRSPDLPHSRYRQRGLG